MEYFKGTKGEWKVDGFIIGSPTYNICDVSLTSGQKYNEAQANARLISAAPDLLDAAASAWIMINDIPEEFMDDFNKRVVNKLNQSISKAGIKLVKSSTIDTD